MASTAPRHGLPQFTHRNLQTKRRSFKGMYGSSRCVLAPFTAES